ncbi:MAG: tetratricopeptide repeat protein [Gemmatimonadaceae bacterium]
MFSVRLFGGLFLDCDAGTIPAGALQRRRLTLLALLALAREQGMTRERIQAFLWPENASDRARHALDQLLYSTRRELGRDSIESSATELHLNSGVVRVDVWQFDDCMREKRWGDAVALYAGPILDGLHLADEVEFDRLVDVERVRRHQNYGCALEHLAMNAADLGDHGAAAQWWRRYAAADPLAGPVALSLMRALAAAGDRAGAIQHARIYQHLVRTTLEIEPDRAIGDLADQLTYADATSTETVRSPMPPLSPIAASDARPPQRRRRTRIWAAAGAFALGLASLTAELLARNQAPVAQADPEIRQLYLRGQASWNTRTKAGLSEAVVLFRRVTERDPTYATAYAGLAQSYALLGYFGFETGDAMFPKARAAAMRALELNPRLGGAYAALGQTLAWEHDWPGAERAYRRAIELANDDPTVHQWYGLLLAYLGRAREAAQHSSEASRLDPLSVQINNMHGMMLFYAGDLAGALRQYERTVVAEPDSAWVKRNPWVLANFSRISAEAGRHSEALRLIERALEVLPTNPRLLLDLAGVHVAAGDLKRARAAYDRADRNHEHFAVYRALFHALMGELDEAFAWFDRVQDFPLPALVGLSNERRFARLRADPRFRAVRDRLHLPES